MNGKMDLLVLDGFLEGTYDRNVYIYGSVETRGFVHIKGDLVITRKGVLTITDAMIVEGDYRVHPDSPTILSSFIPKMPGTCSHDWKTYVGLFDEYVYCSICGDKKT